MLLEVRRRRLETLARCGRLRLRLDEERRCLVTLADCGRLWHRLDEERRWHSH